MSHNCRVTVGAPSAPICSLQGAATKSTRTRHTARAASFEWDEHAYTGGPATPAHRGGVALRGHHDA